MITEKNTIDLWTAETTLVGQKIKLVPLSFEHTEGLTKNLLRPHSWHLVHWDVKTKTDIEKQIQKSIETRLEKTANSFAMVLKSTNEPVGKSHFMNFNRKHNYLEIGGTWVGNDWQKTSVNTEVKLLMLSYAFEIIQVQRVEFRVDSFNFNSQRAVLRLGAKCEGELRNVCVLPDGRSRDYKVYSIIDSEWKNIKKTLEWYLEKYV